MNVDMLVGLAIGSTCGATIGLFLGACLGAGKITDLETANHRLRKLLFEEGKEARFSEIEDAADQLESPEPDDWDPAWGDPCWTPERRER